MTYVRKIDDVSKNNDVVENFNTKSNLHINT